MMNNPSLVGGPGGKGVAVGEGVMVGKGVSALDGRTGDVGTGIGVVSAEGVIVAPVARSPAERTMGRATLLRGVAETGLRSVAWSLALVIWRSEVGAGLG